MIQKVRAGPCQLKTCPNMRCLESRTGKTECVKEKRNRTQAYTELNTTLLDACMVGDVARVKNILSDGQANVNSMGKNNMTPVMHAAKEGHEEVFDLLVWGGANLSLLDDGDRNILHLASIGGNVEIVKYVLTQNIVGINNRDNYRSTPAMNAARYKRKDVFDLLVEAKADLLLLNVYDETILHVACEGGNVQIIKYLLTHATVDIDSRDINGWTSAMHAASDGCKNVLDVLVEEGADLSVVGNERETILHLACGGGNVEIVKYLLSHAIVDVDIQDAAGWTPVMHAVRAGEEDVFNLLVEKEADLLLVNNDKETLLHMVCKVGNVEIIKYLLKHDIVDIDSRDDSGWTPLMCAANNGHKGAFDVLVEAGADLLSVSDAEETILHLSCEGENGEIIKYLLTRKVVDINSRDDSGLTPVMYTALHDSKDVFDLLVKWGADLSLLDADDHNILHLACIEGSPEIVNYLLSHNTVDINSRDQDDCTSAMIAAREGRETVFFQLVENGADLTITNDDGDNILDMACDGGNLHIVEYVSTRHIVKEPNRKDNPC